MKFERQKETQLSRTDHSKKGSIDRKIRGLVNQINKSKDYCTTSSCSGRVLLLAEGSKKNEASWLFVSHNEITFKKLKKELENLPKGTVWFRFEPMIMHVACSSLESAQRLVDFARHAGFKKTGIIASKRRIIVEIRGTDFISVPLAKKAMPADDIYLRLLVNEANRKMKRNWEKIKKLKQLKNLNS